MKFIYNAKIDKKCTDDVNAQEHIFGEEKKTGVFPVTDDTVNSLGSVWTPEIDEKFKKGIHKIFKVDFPTDFTCYINSTPYSMDIPQGISVSASTKTPIRTICHETSHFMFRKSKYKDLYFPNIDIEDAKEIFTIINNLYFKDIMEAQDLGWKNFWRDRYTFIEKWIKTNI
ncbi:MAG: hypothetical protein WCJ59_02975 [bacterium]